MSGRDQVDIMGALFLEFQKNGRQVFDTLFAAQSPVTDGVILAKDAAHRAVAEKTVPEPLVPEMGGSSPMWRPCRATLTLPSPPHTPRAPVTRSTPQAQGHRAQAEAFCRNTSALLFNWAGLRRIAAFQAHPKL